MKTSVLIAILALFPLSFAEAQTPSTPPPATPAPAVAAPVPLTGAPIRTLQSVTASLTPAQFQVALTTVPATPMSLQQLLATFVALPTGVTTTQIRTVDVFVSPTGSARIVVQYLR